MRLSVLLIHYKTPGLVPLALAALEPVIASSDAECVVVDNDGPGAVARGTLPGSARWLDAGGNRGYSGGINLGVQATSGDHIVVLNPDVLVDPGCVERLREELRNGCDVAGPRFCWDRDHRLLIPPAEERSVTNELLAAAAVRSRRLAGVARNRWRRHARRHWQARRPIDSVALSGALLAFTRDAFRRVGGFDEAYRLYFEETDWLMKARRKELVVRYVPEARAVHLFDQAAQHEPSSRDWFAASVLRFRRRHYGVLAARLIGLLERSRPKTVDAAQGSLDQLPPSSQGKQGKGRSGLWIELSPRQLGFPAVGERLVGAELEQAWRAPESLARLHTGLELWGRWVDDLGRELGPPFRGSLAGTPRSEVH